MTITNPLPYFVLLLCFIGIARVFNRLPRPETSKLHITLESLRGLLAVSVLFHHAVVSYFYYQNSKWVLPPSKFYEYLGSAPVTIFFFLSGFLFWSKCIARNGVGSYRSFLMARIRRLVPAYYVTVSLIFFIVLVNAHFKLVESPMTLAIEFARWLVLVPTFGINGFQRAFFINAGVIWTLTLEVCFYLILPLLYRLFKGPQVFLFVAGAIAIHWLLARRGVVFTFTPPASGVAPVLLLIVDLFFGFGFGLGMVTAFLYARCPEHWRQTLQQRRWTLIPLAFLAAPVLLKVEIYTPAQFFLLIVVFLFVAAGNDFFGLLSSPSVFLLGTISYSFYITHGIVLFVFSELLNRWVHIANLSPLQYWTFIGLVGATTVCVSMLLYCKVEYRFMKRSSALHLKSDVTHPASETSVA